MISYRSNKKIELSCLEKIIEVTEIAIKSFPNDRELQISVLVTLCSDRIQESFPIDLNSLIDSIFTLMDNHLKSIDIQINSTLCLWRLARNQLVEKVEPKILKKVIDNTLTAMELFPNERKLQKIV